MTNLDDLVQLLGAQHEIGRACEIAWAVTNPCGTHSLALASGQLENEFALVLAFGLKHGQWCALKAESPVDEAGSGGGTRNSHGSEERVEGIDGDL